MPTPALSVRITPGDFRHGRNLGNGPQDEFYASCAADSSYRAAGVGPSNVQKPPAVDPRTAEFEKYASRVDYGKFIGYEAVTRGLSQESYIERVALIVRQLVPMFEKYTLPVLDLMADPELARTPAAVDRDGERQRPVLAAGGTGTPG